MERGVLTNSALGGWRKAPNEVLCAANGAVTAPFFDPVDGTYQFTRYTVSDDGICSVQIQNEVLAATTVGAGTAYVFRLPVKARRMVPGQADYAPIGTGMCYFSFGSPATNMLCTATLADPWTSLNGQEDWYCQLYAPEVWDWGTTPFTSTSKVVTHRAGYAFAASDLRLTPIDANWTTTARAQAWVDTITSTQFTIHDASGASGTANFGYRVRGIPPSGTGGAVVSPTVPWDWSRFTTLGPFGNIFINVEYPVA